MPSCRTGVELLFGLLGFFFRREFAREALGLGDLGRLQLLSEQVSLGHASGVALAAQMFIHL